MIEKSKLNFGSYHIILMFFMLLYLPLLLSRTDLWDGVILNHTIKIGRSDIYFEWFNEAALFLTPWFYAPLSLPVIRDLYPFSAQLITVVFLYLSALEVCKLAQLLYKINDRQAIWVGLFYLLLPLWSLYFSTIYLMHAGTLYFSLLSVRLVINKRFLLVACSLIIISFQQSSLAPMALAILMLWVIESKGRDIKNVLLFSAWILLSFFVIRDFFPTTGLYQNYNKINVLNLQNITFWTAFAFSTLLICAPVLFSLLLKPRSLFSLSLIGLFVALIVCVVPYVAVGKTTKLMDVFLMHNNGMRFLFPCGPIFALLFAYAISKDAIKEWLCAAVLIYMGYLFVSAQSNKIKDVAFQRAFISAIAEHPEVNGKVILFSSTVSPTPYEYTDALEKAFGINRSFAVVNGSRYYAAAMFSKKSYTVKYILPAEMPAEEIKVKVLSDIHSMGMFELYRRYLSGDDFRGLVSVIVTR